MGCVSRFTPAARVLALAAALVASGAAAAQGPAQQPAGSPPLAKATFAGGCFWCMEPPYDKLPGVVSTISGCKYYRTGCGRDARLLQLWGKPGD